jgi:hypothetical protein
MGLPLVERKAALEELMAKAIELLAARGVANIVPASQLYGGSGGSL